MALTDADRLQMALMAVMRHNVVTISGGNPPDSYLVQVDDLTVAVYDTTLVAIVTQVETLADYILT